MLTLTIFITFNSFLSTKYLLLQIYEFLAYKYPDRIDKSLHVKIGLAKEFKAAVISEV
jgi:hypothetical protein